MGVACKGEKIDEAVEQDAAVNLPHLSQNLIKEGLWPHLGRKHSSDLV